MSPDVEQAWERLALARLWETEDDDPAWSFLSAHPGYTSAWWYPWHEATVIQGLRGARTADDVGSDRVATCHMRAEDPSWSWVVYVVPLAPGDSPVAVFASRPDPVMVPSLMAVCDDPVAAWDLVRRCGAFGSEAETLPRIGSLTETARPADPAGW